jgi:hypothetical protein
MKLHRPPKKQSPEGVELKRLFRAFQVVSMGLVAHLKRNSVVSDDELETVTRNAGETLETVKEVLSRVLSLTESDAGQLGDVELGVRFERQQSEILYLVETVVPMLEKLYNLRHITEHEYWSLTRYWRSIPAQHQLLVDRWERARNF